MDFDESPVPVWTKEKRALFTSRLRSAHVTISYAIPSPLTDNPNPNPQTLVQLRQQRREGPSTQKGKLVVMEQQLAIHQS